jgi:hypothetical protein
MPLAISSTAGNLQRPNHADSSISIRHVLKPDFQNTQDTNSLHSAPGPRLINRIFLLKDFEVSTNG